MNKVSQEIIDVFLESAKEIFLAMGIPIQSGSLEIQKNPQSLNGDISGVIPLVSSKVSGNLIMSFPMNTYLSIMSKLLNAEHKELSLEIQDGASEFSNMILGSAKVKLNVIGHDFQPAIPKVILGSNQSAVSGKNMTSVSIALQSSFGPFVLDLRTIDF